MYKVQDIDNVRDVNVRVKNTSTLSQNFVNLTYVYVSWLIMLDHYYPCENV
ncbi:hypothetical protein DEO72_LG2g709 [Vigna unguiculata]|uniref:Uncharacterized protein n=1 Tax=Vigna unguiculata TaxID=3917 RepID=A0A4D6KRT0_VIGUN|nr:hypothetical protein DEO72_LG2g709 [Vigna unguiculata]